MNELKIIRADYVNQRDIIWVACVKIGEEDLDELMTKLEALPKQQTIVHLDGRPIGEGEPA